MALRNQPYIPLYVQDFLTDEKLMECSAASTGIYIRLLCIMHKSNEYGTILLKQKDQQTNQQIKNFAVKLARHMPYTLVEIFDSLNELIDEGVIQVNGTKLLQKRMLEDNRISLLRSKAGKIGGFASANRLAKESANTENESEYEIEYENEKKLNNKKKKKQLDCFENIWGQYPKRIGKKQALKHFLASVKTKEDWENIQNALKKYKNYITMESIDEQYIKHGSSWFNNWEDWK